MAAMKTRKKSFEATLDHAGVGEVALIEVPFDVKAFFGKARPPIVANVGGYEFRTTPAIYGGKTFVGLRKSHVQASGLKFGQSVKVTLTLDAEERTVATPKELAAAFKKDKKAAAAWEKLSFTHKKEHAEAISGAKKPETRARRVEKALAMLRAR
jgi:hypothetical protein